MWNRTGFQHGEWRLFTNCTTLPVQVVPGDRHTNYDFVRAQQMAVTGLSILIGVLAIWPSVGCAQNKAKPLTTSAATPAGALRVNPRDAQPYVWIPAGSYTMGCSPGDRECYGNEKSPHPVKLTKGFWMGQTAVTVEAWKRYRVRAAKTALDTVGPEGRKNYNEAGDGKMPAVMMTWEQAASFCDWTGMRLPTEAEWEYAARAGTASARYGDLDSIAWYANNSGRRRIDSQAMGRQVDGTTYNQKLVENGTFMHHVGLKQPNAWKLYDMLGNVSVWTADWYDAGYYAKSAAADPPGPSSGQTRVVRGGSWLNAPDNLRISRRFDLDPGSIWYVVGCRCVGELP